MTRPDQRKVHGRRKGPALSARRQNLLAALLPGLAIPDPDGGRLDPAALFPGPCSDYWLEIGFGGGEHLMWQALNNPATGMLGCEPYINGVAKLLAQIDETGVRNIAIYNNDARDLLEALPDNTIARIFLLFPDPWPKTRHHKRRFVNAENLHHIHRVLVPGGEFRFASDIAGYVRWTLFELRRFGKLDWTAEGPDDWRRRGPDWPQTRYEAKAASQNRASCYLTFRKPPGV